jgi:hypothetical protein
MTLEEALSKVTDAEAKATLQKIITDQNKYIGQLEQISKAAKATPTATDDVTLKYIEKKMRADVIAEAITEIKKDVSEEVYKAVEQDYLEFLDKSMKKENTTVAFCTDAFSLVLGKCLRMKDHPVNQIGKGSNPQTATPAAQGNGNTNGQSVATVQNIIKNQPPIMSDRDVTGASTTGLPDTSIQPKNTRDAFKSLKERFGSVGGNRFQ